MLCHAVPDLCWQYVSQYILKYSSRYYLVTVDHYCEFFEFENLSDLHSLWVIEVTKSVFAHHQSPTICLTETGPQIISETYTQFANQLNFQHLPSSPYYCQTNGCAGVVVKSTKESFEKMF